jgi:hypothetical protein
MPAHPKRDPLVISLIQQADMFGHQINFNINGETSFKTCPGACVSLFIFAWLGLLLHYLLLTIVIEDKYRVVS